MPVFDVKLEESEKAGSHQELNLGHLACAASALPLSYDNPGTSTYKMDGFNSYPSSSSLLTTSL